MERASIVDYREFKSAILKLQNSRTDEIESTE